jgi:enterochelin esterase-like enzyme
VFYSYSQGQESKLENFIFYSESLKELRELTVYFPESFNSDSSYKVVFCADGQFINEQYKIKLDSVYQIEGISPFVIIGVHSNEKETSNPYFTYRHFEYIENEKYDNSDLGYRFIRHLNFFVNEVDKYAKEELRLKISSKYFYGVSNGAGFGVSVSKYYPEIFSKYILYSMAGGNYKNLKWNSTKYPFFIIKCGSEEPEPFIECSKKFSKYLSKKHYKHLFEIYNGGHKREDWVNLFVEDIKKL